MPVSQDRLLSVAQAANTVLFAYQTIESTSRRLMRDVGANVVSTEAALVQLAMVIRDSTPDIETIQLIQQELTRVKERYRANARKNELRQLRLRGDPGLTPEVLSTPES